MTLQWISRAPPPTMTSAQETAYNPKLTTRSTFPTWTHERQESIATRNAWPEGQNDPPRNEVRISPQIFLHDQHWWIPNPSPWLLPTTMTSLPQLYLPPDFHRIQWILLQHTNGHNQISTSIPLTGIFLLFPLQDSEEHHLNIQILTHETWASQAALWEDSNPI